MEMIATVAQNCPSPTESGGRVLGQIGEYSLTRQFAEPTRRKLLRSMPHRSREEV